MPIYKTSLLNRYLIAANTMVFEFAKPKGLSFIPGQYGTFIVPKKESLTNNDTCRRFTFLHSCQSDRIAFITRINSHSSFKKSLQNLRESDVITLIGPMGDFTLHKNVEIPAVFIAGGVGIAPFYSIMSQLKNHAISRKVTLFFGCRSAADMPFINELQQLKNNQNGISFIPIIENNESYWHGEIGYFSCSMLQKYITNIFEPIYYICGSPNMVASIKTLLLSMNIDEQQIKLESI